METGQSLHADTNADALAAAPPTSARAYGETRTPYEARASNEARPSSEVRLLKVVLSAALLCGLALSRRLWVSTGRFYPAVPAFDFLPRVTAPFDYVLFAAFVASLVSAAIRTRPKLDAIAFVLLASALALLDESRLQPWFYQYLFMMFALASYSWGRAEARASSEDGNARGAMRACALAVSCVYFWSGVQKLNPQFFVEVVPSLAAPYLARMPATFARLAGALAVLIPLTEICAGLFLLTRRLRRVGVVLALVTHAFVLMLFVPFRRNDVIWPWNIATAALVLILFRRGARTPEDFLPRRLLSLQTLALALFGMMPALSLFGLWGQYQSAALYSGNVPRAEFTVSEGVARKLPPRVRGKLRPAPGGFLLDINHWSYAELNVPAYPSERVYRRAAGALCELAESPADVRLDVTAPPRFFGDAARATSTPDCDALKASR